MAYSISLKTVALKDTASHTIGETYREIYHHIQQFFGITKTGVRMAYSNGLRRNYMVKYANKSKKTAMDYLNHDWFPSGEKYL
jgi:hypothetical protein